MSHTLVFNQDEALAEWARKRIPWAGAQDNVRAVGVADGGDLSARLLAVCLYFNYVAPYEIAGKKWGGTCEIGFAAASPRWATRRTIINLLRIPFVQYDCRKVFTVIPSTNARAIKFNIGVGLRLEGTLRNHFARGVHASVHGLMKTEFEKRWLAPTGPTERMQHHEHGEGRRVELSAASA